MQALPSVSCVFATDVATAITAGSGAAARERGGHTGAHRCVLRAGGAQCLCGIGGGGGTTQTAKWKGGDIGMLASAKPRGNSPVSSAGREQTAGEHPSTVYPSKSTKYLHCQWGSPTHGELT